jgi:hypothetical protein
MISRRLHWLIPRFSLSNVLMLMVVVGLCLAWYDQRRKLGEQAEVIDEQRLEIKRLKIDSIMNSNETDGEKARRLNEFIKLGDPILGIEKLSDDAPRNYGGGVTTCQIGSLQVNCDNGRVTDFGYWTSMAVAHNALTFVSLGADYADSNP